VNCYKSLACAVIQQAVVDAKQVVTKKTRNDQEDAQDFILSDRLDNHITAYQLELHPDAVRRSLDGRVYRGFLHQIRRKRNV